MRRPYCGDCGQKRGDMRRSVWALIAEFAQDQFSLNSKFVRTVRRLLLAPGHVARDFAFGKRSSFTSPIRLFLVASFALFLTLGTSKRLFVALSVIETAPQSGAATSIKVSGQVVNCDLQLDMHFLVRSTEVSVDQHAWDQCSVQIRNAMERAIDVRLAEDPAAKAKRTRALGYFEIGLAGVTALLSDPAGFNLRLNDWLARVILLMTPLFAAISAVVVRRGTLYFDQLVFSLYAHSAAFLIVTITSLGALAGIPYPAPVGAGMLAIHFALSLRNAFHLHWPKALISALAILAAYAIFLSTAVIALVAVTVWRAG